MTTNSQARALHRIRAVQTTQDRIFDIRAEIARADQQRLLDQRKQRLALMHAQLHRESPAN